MDSSRIAHPARAPAPRRAPEMLLQHSARSLASRRAAGLGGILVVREAVAGRRLLPSAAHSRKIGRASLWKTSLATSSLGHSDVSSLLGLDSPAFAASGCPGLCCFLKEFIRQSFHEISAENDA